MKLDRLIILPLAVAAGLMLYAVFSKGKVTKVEIKRSAPIPVASDKTEDSENVKPKLSDPDRAVKAGDPLVIHVIVALCDNTHQGIVKVNSEMGNGQNPDTNLYWGAMYGVKTFLKNRGWFTTGVVKQKEGSPVLDKIVFQKTILRKGKPVNVYLAAEAWDGKYIKEALVRFVRMSAGLHGEELVFSSTRDQIDVGGKANMIVFVGHNGLMDFDIGSIQTPLGKRIPQTAVVLACKSEAYFNKIIPIFPGRQKLFTTGLLAPEAYILNAVADAWASGKPVEEIRTAAAESYSLYQKCSKDAASRLFSVLTDPAE